MLKIIVIDPTNKTITETKIEGELKEFQRLVGGYIESACYLTSEDVVYVNEEGMINGKPDGMFILKGGAQPLKGVGLVVGIDNKGNGLDTTLTVDHIKGLVRFLS